MSNAAEQHLRELCQRSSPSRCARQRFEDCSTVGTVLVRFKSCDGDFDAYLCKLCALDAMARLPRGCVELLQS